MSNVTTDNAMDKHRSNWQRADVPPWEEMPRSQEEMPAGSMVGRRKIGRDQMKALVDLIRNWLPEQNTQANPYSPCILFMALLEMGGGSVCELTESQARFLFNLATQASRRQMQWLDDFGRDDGGELPFR